MHVANGTYHVRMHGRTDEPTPPALCLSTLMPRQKTARPSNIPIHSSAFLSAILSQLAAL